MTLKWLNWILRQWERLSHQQQRKSSHRLHDSISNQRRMQEKKLRLLLFTINGMSVWMKFQPQFCHWAQFSLFKRRLFCVVACVCDVRALCFLNSNRNDYTSTWNEPVVFRKKTKKKLERIVWCMDGTIWMQFSQEIWDTCSHLGLSRAHTHTHNSHKSHNCFVI